jgi:predicted lysophospholipase L1 biosynthesis ABC-type transport system permease subunit
MRPLTVLIGIVMGSAVSLAVGLLLTWIVLLFLPEYAEELAEEQKPLAIAIAIFTLIAAAAAASFYGEIHERRWRWATHAMMAIFLTIAVWNYWPD